MRPTSYIARPKGFKAVSLWILKNPIQNIPSYFRALKQERHRKYKINNQETVQLPSTTTSTSQTIAQGDAVTSSNAAIIPTKSPDLTVSEILVTMDKFLKTTIPPRMIWRWNDKRCSARQDRIDSMKQLSSVLKISISFNEDRKLSFVWNRYFVARSYLLVYSKAIYTT
jgi:hypothetical protein